MKKAESVFVRNNGAETFKNRFDGEDFEIEPGQALEMYVDCATLVLGFGEDDKTRALRRLGWISAQHDVKTALERLSKFSFHMSEKEASDHVHSSAPVVAGAPAGSAQSGGVGSDPDVAEPQRKHVSPLGKLARAQEAAA